MKELTPQLVRISRKALLRICPPQENYCGGYDAGEWSDAAAAEAEEVRMWRAVQRIAAVIGVSAEQLEKELYCAECREYDKRCESIMRRK